MNLLESREGKELVNQVAYTIISDNAPEEIAIYVSNRDRYFLNPDNYVNPNNVDDDPSSAGVTEVIVALTQTMLILAQPLLTIIFKKYLEAMGQQAGKSSVESLTKWFQSANPQPIFSGSDIEEIERKFQQLIEEDEIILGLEKEKVMIIKNALIVKLALAKK